jgi:hypothetical protein
MTPTTQPMEAHMRKYVIIIGMAVVMVDLVTAVFWATAGVPANSAYTASSKAFNSGSSFPGHSFQPVW